MSAPSQPNKNRKLFAATKSLSFTPSHHQPFYPGGPADRYGPVALCARFPAGLPFSGFSINTLAYFRCVCQTQHIPIRLLVTYITEALGWLMEVVWQNGSSLFCAGKGGKKRRRQAAPLQNKGYLETLFRSVGTCTRRKVLGKRSRMLYQRHGLSRL